MTAAVTWIESLGFGQFLALLVTAFAAVAGLAAAGIWRATAPRPPAAPLTETEAVAAIAAAVTCTRCRDHGHGRCVCTRDCTHPACRGKRLRKGAGLATWTDADVAFVEDTRKEMPR